MIGCQSCVDKWFKNSSDEKCPFCGSDRAYADTCQLKGFDELLQGLVVVFVVLLQDMKYSQWTESINELNFVLI